ncbi:MAG: hypothetical protein JOZ87_14160 [Chloroflexi bacterium]|nr:hypothetical protein [Chloroflexota bacterium]
MTALLIGALFAACVISTGYGVVRLSRLASDELAIGLSPAVGLAVLIMLTTWSRLVGLSPAVAALMLIGGASLGIRMAVLDLGSWRTRLRQSGELRLTLILVVLSLIVTSAVLGLGFNGIVVPVSSDDGAHHVEIVDQLRRGGDWSGWYPLGFHSVAAAFLQLFPQVDTALGALGVGLGLALLAPISVFGLGVVILRRLPAAGAAAVLVGLTAQYPYHLQFWDGWPLAIGIILALGVWTVAILYVDQPSVVWVRLAAPLAASILVTHGTELYTVAIGLVGVLIAGCRRVNWRVLPPHLMLALVLAVVLSAPYLSGLVEFYRAGGAQAAGDADLAAMSLPSADLDGLRGTLQLVLDAMAGIVVDAPVRVGIVLVGAVSVFSTRTGRLLLPLGLTFVALAIMFRGLHAPAVDRLYALTFPWSQDYRLLMITAICASLLGGAGLLVVGEWASRRRGWLSSPKALLVPVVLAQVTVALMAQRFSAEAVYYLTYSPDDAAAFAWLAQHIQPGELLVNDGSADAGIWAPYKAGASVLLPRVLPVPDRSDRQQILDHVDDLQDSPETLTAACGLGARYIYVGASGTLYEQRQLPRAATLQHSPDLDEVFSQGAAAVFRLRCD